MTSTIRSPFDDRMKTALGDEDVWDRLLAEDDLRDTVREWLLDTIQGIDRQLSYNHDSLQEAKLAGDTDDLQHRELEFYRWRKRAMHLKHLCMKRNRQLNDLQTRESSQEKEFKALLINLADTVRDHQSGRATDDELHAELDDLQLPVEPAASLRQYLEILDRQEDESA